MLDFIKEEDVVITISHLGYIKRTTASDYRQQRRVDVAPLAVKQEKKIM
jgi:DNA gyrase/topoisomerase IV subunit A